MRDFLFALRMSSSCSGASSHPRTQGPEQSFAPRASSSARPPPPNWLRPNQRQEGIGETRRWHMVSGPFRSLRRFVSWRSETPGPRGPRPRAAPPHPPEAARRSAARGVEWWRGQWRGRRETSHFGGRPIVRQVTSSEYEQRQLVEPCDW